MINNKKRFANTNRYWQQIWSGEMHHQPNSLDSVEGDALPFDSVPIRFEFNELHFRSFLHWCHHLYRLRQVWWHHTRGLRVVLGLDYQIPLTGRLSWISKHSYQTVPFCTKLLQALLNAPILYHAVPCVWCRTNSQFSGHILFKILFMHTSFWNAIRPPKSSQRN